MSLSAFLGSYMRKKYRLILLITGYAFALIDDTVECLKKRLIKPGPGYQIL
jgi:hypothetical protein